MDWQAVTAGALVLVCSVWAVVMFLPARARFACRAWGRARLGLHPQAAPSDAAGGCGGCGGCGGGGGGGAPPPGAAQKVHIVRRAPAD